MVHKLKDLDCDLSLQQIVSHHLAKATNDEVPYKGIYKVRFDQRDSLSENKDQCTNASQLLKELKNSFVKIKVKQ